eukprot:scaffold742_cov165-Amphora_coffeaeformis.AAC.21
MSHQRDLLLTGALGLIAGGALAYPFWSAKNKPDQEPQDPVAVVEQVIANRRTVQAAYFDTQATVPRASIDRLLEAANWAPTHGKTEPWRFIVFETESARRALGETDAAIYKDTTDPAKFMDKKYKKKIDSKLQSSYVIAICMKRQESKKLPLEEEQMAVACAVQNMHLLGSAMGLGCCWLSGPTVRTQAMKDYLKLEGPEDECLGFFCIGKPDPEKVSPKSQRKPVQEKVRYM